MAKNTNATIEQIPYTPNDWNDSQLALHRADHLDAAFKNASCLTGGWYQRAVRIDWQADDNNADTGEAYMIVPAEVPILDGWEACYTVNRA